MTTDEAKMAAYETESRDPDARIHGAEQRLFARYGESPIERFASIGEPPMRVRLLEFAGGGGTPVVLMHGIASVTAAAAPLLPWLTANHQVIAVDWPGHGLSAPFQPPRGPGVREHAVQVLEELLDDLGLDVVDLVGHSMGGQFALYYALHAPQRVRRMVILGAPGAGFTEVRPPSVMRLAAVPGLGPALLSLRQSESSYRKRAEAGLGKGAFDAHPIEVVQVGHLASRRPGFAPSVAAYFRAFITPRGPRPGVPLTHAELAGLVPPVLLVWGDEDTVLTSQAAQPSIDSIPHATLVRTGGGHAPWLQEPDSCGEAIAAFLDAA